MELFSNLYNKFISKSVFDEKNLCWDTDTRYLRTIYSLKWEKLTPEDPYKFIRAIHVLEIKFILGKKYGASCDSDEILSRLLTTDKSNLLIAHQLYVEGYCGSV